jgi:hypothetical protein
MPERISAPRNTMAANPTPPAAPAPGRSAASTPVAALATAAQRARAASSRATSSGEAPFWGPYTAAAPCRPSRGLSTSEATVTSWPPTP